MPTPISAKSLRALRKMKGWSYDDLERESGVSKRSLIRYEDPGYEGTPSTRQVERLAKAFGLSSKELSLEHEHIIVADGQFVPIRIAVIENCEEGGKTKVRWVGNAPEDGRKSLIERAKSPHKLAPNQHYVAMPDEASGTLFATVDEEVQQET